MLAHLKRQAPMSAPTNVVNGDIKIVEDIDGKTVVHADTTPQGPSTRPKFKPVDPALRAAFDAQAIAENKKAAPPSNNFDLVGDDIGAPPQPKRTGRTRLYPTDAARQQAYRERKKQGG